MRGHFIAGELLPADDSSQNFNPSNGKPVSIATIGTAAEVDGAVAAAGASLTTRVEELSSVVTNTIVHSTHCK